MNHNFENVNICFYSKLDFVEDIKEKITILKNDPDLFSSLE